MILGHFIRRLQCVDGQFSQIALDQILVDQNDFPDGYHMAEVEQESLSEYFVDEVYVIASGAQNIANDLVCQFFICGGFVGLDGDI